MNRAVGAGKQFVVLIPGAMPQAGISRTVGPEAKRQRRVFIPAWGNAPGKDPKTEPGLKARPISIPPHASPFAPMNRAVGAAKHYVGLDSWGVSPGWYQAGRWP
jgi:hypothetical protein